MDGPCSLKFWETTYCPTVLPWMCGRMFPGAGTLWPLAPANGRPCRVLPTGMADMIPISPRRACW